MAALAPRAVGFPPARPHLVSRTNAKNLEEATIMEQREILTRLRALLRNGAGYEIDANAPTPEERKRIQASMDDAAADAAEAEIEMESLL
ncbi:MAG: hypothetical protein ACREPJ_03275, partial [Rhodanobacteraceae bacterium]